MKLYFENSDGKKRVIAAPRTRDEAFDIIRAFCKERNFKIHYIRTWREPDDAEVFDVGSWTERFLLED